MGIGRHFWSGRKYQLSRMSLRELVAAYFQYPAIQVYLALLAGSGLLAVHLAADWLQPLAAVLAVLLLYPALEYALHRFVLHGRFLYRSPGTATLWKRIHYDHHQNPDDLRVLFGALHTTLPVVVVVALPLGALIGGAAGAAAAFAAGLACLLFFEFCHCVEHLRYTPRNRFLRRIKRHHLLHHFHNETGNFGLTGTLVDRLVGSYYASAAEVAHSETVFDLGYAGEERRRYPWVARLSEIPKRRLDRDLHRHRAGSGSAAR